MFRPIIIFVICFLLVGCQQPLSYDYLITHLDVLKKEVASCEKINDSYVTSEQKNRCDIVTYTAAQIISTANEEQENPQLFGKRILSLEFDYVNAKNKLKKVKEQLTMLRKNGGDVTATLAELKQAKDSYEKLDQEVKLYLAVAGMGSPE